MSDLRNHLNQYPIETLDKITLEYVRSHAEKRLADHEEERACFTCPNALAEYDKIFGKDMERDHDIIARVNAELNERNTDV